MPIRNPGAGGESGAAVPYVSSSPPADPKNGMLWWDTDDPGVGGMNEALVVYKDGNISYICKADIGSPRSSPVWQISRMDSSGTELVITWCDGDEYYDNAATDLEAVSIYNYS